MRRPTEATIWVNFGLILLTFSLMLGISRQLICGDCNVKSTCKFSLSVAILTIFCGEEFSVQSWEFVYYL